MKREASAGVSSAHEKCVSYNVLQRSLSMIPLLSIDKIEFGNLDTLAGA